MDSLDTEIQVKYRCISTCLPRHKALILLIIKPLTAVPAKPGRTGLHCFKTLQLSQSREYCLNCQLWVYVLKIGKTKKHKKISAFCKTNYHFMNLGKNKNDFYVFCPQLFSKIIIAKPKVNLHNKFSPCSSLKVTFFFIHFPGWATAFCSSASWPCLDFQHHDCIACWEINIIFDRARSFPYSTATPTYLRNFALAVIFSGRKFQNMSW